MAIPTLDGLCAGALLADKGFDDRKLATWSEARGMRAIIPSRRNARKPRVIDLDLYRWRKCVEHTINRLKQCRAVATRYCKRARNYLGFVHLAAALLLEPPRVCRRLQILRDWSYGESQDIREVLGRGA